MQRDIVKSFQKWKNDQKRKPLVITGVRQCGKTYIMKEFGENNFQYVVYINLEKNELAAAAFEYDFDVHRIVQELVTMSGTAEFVPGDTLLILDEIQACPRAITALKYFCEDMRELHIMCAGSLLGVAMNHINISFPVGKIDRLQMYPMSLKEFLLANGEDSLINVLDKYTDDRPIPEPYMKKLENYYRQYLLIGGMPEVVCDWIENHNYERITKLQDNILQDYAADFSKYAPTNEVPKLQVIWESVPKQLAKENNKFVFSQVKAGKRAHELENALQWLVAAGLVYKCELSATPNIPLSFSADGNYFKVYMSDVGLLCRRTGLFYKSVLADDNLFSSFKGALAENYVHNELCKNDLVPYFWRSGNTAEVDFLVEYEGNIIPIEVKSADNTRAKSLNLFCKKYNPKKTIKFSLKNIGINEVDNTRNVNLPLYMSWKVRGYLK